MAFIVLEGLDGSGKSTLISALSEHLTKKFNVDHIITEEPGGTTVGNQIKAVLLDKKNRSLCAKTELLLYQSIRAQHVHDIINPALKEKKWVICDRFTASSIAFQSKGRGIDLTQVKYLNKFATDNTTADLTVLIDIDPRTSKNRINKRKISVGQEKDRFEIEELDFHTNVRNSYLEQAKNSLNWLILNGNDSTEKNKTQLIDEFHKRGWIS